MNFELNLVESAFFLVLFFSWTIALMWSNKKLTDKIVSLKLRNEHLEKYARRKKRQNKGKYVKLGKNVYVQEGYAKKMKEIKE
jgi:hypothetical protein